MLWKNNTKMKKMKDDRWSVVCCPLSVCLSYKFIKQNQALKSCVKIKLQNRASKSSVKIKHQNQKSKSKVKIKSQNQVSKSSIIKSLNIASRLSSIKHSDFAVPLYFGNLNLDSAKESNKIYWKNSQSLTAKAVRLYDFTNIFCYFL